MSAFPSAPLHAPQPKVSRLADAPATQSYQVANFLDRFFEVLRDLVVGQAQHRITGEGQFIVAMPILHERHAIAMTAPAVEFDREPATGPDQIDLRPRAA